MGNKKHELTILDKCISFGLKKGGITKRIMVKLQGEEFPRDDHERPDFIRVYQPSCKNVKPVLIGVEHFLVDQQISRKGSSYQSNTQKNQAQIRKIYDQYAGPISRDEDCIEDAVKDLSKQVAIQTQSFANASYGSFLRHLRFVLSEKHASKFLEYKDNLRKLATDKYDVELAIVIEVKTCFKTCFLSDDKGLRLIKEPIAPTLIEVINEIKKTCSRDVDYIVFYFDYFSKDYGYDVVAVRPNTIEVDLKKQGYNIYTYVSVDDDIQYKLSIEDIVKEGEDYSLLTRNELNVGNPSDYLDAVLNDVHRVWELKQNNQNYVTDISVQYYLEVFGPYIVDWTMIIKDDEEIYKPVFSAAINNLSQDDLEDLSNRFDERWGIYSLRNK